jgi:ribosomal protein S18 acetylase RimI-like enzyme
MEIKPLTEIDHNTLNRLITGYVSDSKYVVNWEDSDRKSLIALELTLLDKPYVKTYERIDDETLERYQQIVKSGYSLGAYEDSRLVALAIAEVHHWNASLWVWEFHVAESCRGRGIGRALMDTLVEKAGAAHVRVMVCETQNTNVPAIRFYRRMGFRLEGINFSLYSNDDWPDGEIALAMKRHLT